MYNILRSFDPETVSNCINPYAVDVIRAKRRDLVYGISHTEDLLDQLVREGVMTAAKRSIILTIRTRTDQNSRVLDILEARGEPACRKFFHPCLMRTEPDLYQRIRTYVNHVNDHIKDTRRQLIGYLLEREKEGKAEIVTKRQKKVKSVIDLEETKGVSTESENTRLLQTEKVGAGGAECTTENLIYMIATDGELVLLEELLEDNNINTVSSSNETLLHVAAKHGHLSITELLIRKGARIDLQDDNGHTALHCAASKGHTQIIRALLMAGAPIYSLDQNNKTAVHLAAENERRDSVEVLVKGEAEQCDKHDTFLHMAAVEDDWRLAELLLRHGASVNATNSHEKTALFYAVRNGNEKTVNVLLKAGAKVDRDVIDEAIRLSHESVLRLLLQFLSEELLAAALFSAVRQNQFGAVAVLAENGADVNSRDKKGYTPLLLSAELGYADVFRVLLERKSRVDATLPDLSTALHLAVHGGNCSITQTLLEKGLNPNIPGPKAQNPLHIAARSNKSDLVDLLVNAGAQVNAVTQDGLTPLHLASQQDYANVVIRLLQSKANPGAKDKLGRSALHWAAVTQGEREVMDLLLSARADPTTTDNEKRTALHLAAMAGNLKAVTSLLSHKVKGCAKDMNGFTALHHAAAGGHASVVSALLRSLDKKGVEEKNAWRKTPLHCAADKGHDSVVALLLEAGAKVNSTDHSKDTPLHCAARGGHQGAVKRLVNWGQAAHMGRQRVNLNATNNVGKTPLQVAECEDASEHRDIAAFLRRRMFLIK